jgi:hypothetical protein
MRSPARQPLVHVSAMTQAGRRAGAAGCVLLHGGGFGRMRDGGGFGRSAAGLVRSGWAWGLVLRCPGPTGCGEPPRPLPTMCRRAQAQLRVPSAQVRARRPRDGERLRSCAAGCAQGAAERRPPRYPGTARAARRRIARRRIARRGGGRRRLAVGSARAGPRAAQRRLFANVQWFCLPIGHRPMRRSRWGRFARTGLAPRPRSGPPLRLARLAELSSIFATATPASTRPW